MEFFEVLEKRRSIRAYKKKEVEKEKLKKILETANLAPSAGNLQSYKIFVVKGKKKEEMVASNYFHQEFLSEAPVVLIFCADQRTSPRYGERGEKLYSV